MQISDIFLNQSTYLERSFIILTITAHGLNQFADNGPAFYFMKPTFECKSLNEVYEYCSQQDVCSQKFEYRISDSSPWNLRTQFDIYCDNEYLKAQSIAIMFSMAVFGSVFLIIYKLKNNHLAYIVCLLINVIGLILFQFQTTLIGKSIFLGLAFNLVNVVFTANFWILQKSVLKEKASQILGPVDGMAWGLTGIIIPNVLLQLNGNISHLMIFVSMVQFLILAKFIKDFPLNEYSNQKQEETLEINVIEIFRNNRQLIINALIQSYEFVLFFYSIISIAIEMQTFGGDIYFNMMIFELCSIVGNFISHSLTHKEKFVTLTFMGLLQLLYLFKTQQSSGFIFLITMFVIKITGEALFTLNMKLIFQYLPLETIQFFLGCNQFCIRLLLVLLPYIILFIRSYNIHPLFVFGIMTLIGSYLQRYKKLLNDEDYESPDSDFIKQQLDGINAMNMRPSFNNKFITTDLQNSLIGSNSQQFSIARSSSISIIKQRQTIIQQKESI